MVCSVQTTTLFSDSWTRIAGCRPKKKRLSAPGAKPSKKKAMLNKFAPRSSNSIVQAAEEAAGGEKPPSPTRSSKAAKRKRLSEAEQLGEVGDGEEGGGDGEEEGQWEQRRKSSRTAVVVKAIEREANRAAQQPRVKHLRTLEGCG